MSESNVLLQPIVVLEPGRPGPIVAGCEAVVRPGSTLESGDLSACRAILDAVARQPTSGKLFLTDLPEPTFSAGVGARFQHLVRRHGIHETNVVLVLPDSLSTLESRVSDRIAAELRDHGFGLALGGYGCRASDLSLIERLPLDFVKLDARFARDVHLSRSKQAVVKSVLTLGRELDLRIVIEGVATRDELDAIHRLGATHAQGDVFSPPVAAARFATVVESVGELYLEQRRQVGSSIVGRPAALLDRDGAHELANLVAGMTLLAEQILESVADDHPLREDLQLIGSAGVRAGELTQKLQEAVAPPEPVAPEAELEALGPPKSATEIN